MQNCITRLWLSSELGNDVMSLIFILKIGIFNICCLQRRSRMLLQLLKVWARISCKYCSQSPATPERCWIFISVTYFTSGKLWNVLTLLSNERNKTESNITKSLLPPASFPPFWLLNYFLQMLIFFIYLGQNVE